MAKLLGDGRKREWVGKLGRWVAKLGTGRRTAHLGG
jgi:hypothetical protein